MEFFSLFITARFLDALRHHLHQFLGHIVQKLIVRSRQIQAAFDAVFIKLLMTVIDRARLPQSSAVPLTTGTKHFPFVLHRVSVFFILL